MTQNITREIEELKTVHGNTIITDITGTFEEIAMIVYSSFSDDYKSLNGFRPQQPLTVNKTLEMITDLQEEFERISEFEDLESKRVLHGITFNGQQLTVKDCPQYIDSDWEVI